MPATHSRSAFPEPFVSDSAHPGLGLKNRKILIVAEDRGKVRSLCEILRPAGYMVSDAKSGDAVMEAYTDFDPDLLLLDVELPGVHAFEICRYLKNLRGPDAATVIFIASRSEPAEVVDGLAAGGVDYISRPFREKEVLARIRVHLLNRLRLAQLHKEDRAKSRLLSMTAHDLRNPLVSVRALSHLLRKDAAGPVTPFQRDLLDTIYDASQSMIDMVTELLERSVLDAGEMKMVLQPVSLTALVESSVKLNNATAAEKNSTIVFERGALPEHLPLDAPKVRQVLNNVLGNALKFSPPGSTITVVTDATATECRVAVRDQGPGIPASEHHRLFKEFGRTSVRPTAGEPSTGLGLAISGRIMQAHGGSISVENRPEGGAEFRLVFPFIR